MTAAAQDVFPPIDASRQECITDEQARFFMDNGLLLIRGLLRGAELKAIQEETLKLVERSVREQPDEPDYRYKTHEITGKRVPCRIEYVIDKCPACKVLLGHPFILRSVEKLQGRNLIPTWDSMVFKAEGGGAAVPWHRDAGTQCVSDTPIFNVDFYPDGSDLSNCLWGVLGSNRWSAEDAQAAIRRLNQGGFQTEGAVPIPVHLGDVLFHNILVLHGSPAAQSRLRQVLYYEFRAAETEWNLGPHTREYLPLKQRVLQACLRHRAKAPYARCEKPFVYNPGPEFPPPPLGPEEELNTYRYPHEKYWRDGKR